MCPHCQHELAAKDLVPVISWLYLRGKCRYCDKSISWQYPAVELSTAALFVFSYLFWPQPFAGWEWLQLGLWLSILTGLIALAVYDIKYMLLPNKLVFPLIYIAILAVMAAALTQNSPEPLKTATIGAAVGGGIFYLLFQLSDGAWIGGGDVKLGFLLGILVGGPGAALLMLFLASLLGTVFALPQIVTKNVGVKAKIPFGPFLIAAAVAAKLFSSDLIGAYTRAFL